MSHSSAPPPLTPQPRRGELSAEQHSHTPTLPRVALALHMHVGLPAPGSKPSSARTLAGQRASLRRATAALAFATPSLPKPNQRLKWITHSALIIPDPNPGQFDPRSTIYGELRRVPKPLRRGEWFPGEQRRRRRLGSI